MAFTKALYYPTIEINDTVWLKSAALYWDCIQTIVPASIRRPYENPIALTLQDAGILVPFIVNQDSPEVMGISKTAIKYIRTQEAQQISLARSGKLYDLHQDKLPREFNLHSDKLSHFVKRTIERNINEEGWYRAPTNFAAFYMTILANEICERRGLALLSDNTFASNLADRARLDNEVNRVRNFRSHRPQHTQLAEALLTNLVIQGIRIRQDMSIKKIIDFKRKHTDELGAFRSNISTLVKNASQQKTLEAMRQYVLDIYKNEFLPGLNNLTKALDSEKVKWSYETLFKLSVISFASTNLLPMAGLTIPQALLVSTGLYIVGNKVLFNESKKKLLRESPYSYVMMAEKTSNVQRFKDFVNKTIT